MMRAIQWINADFHLLKRKNKDGTYTYHAAFLDPLRGQNSKSRYRTIRSTKTGNKALARKRAVQMLQDGSVFAAQDDLTTFLIDFWTPAKSEYIRSKKAEGRSLSESYCHNNRKLIEKYFLPYFTERNLTKLSSIRWKEHCIAAIA